MHLRVVLLALHRRTEPVSAPWRLLGGLVLAADLPGAATEPALERQRADAILAGPAALRALDRVGHFTPFPLHDWHVIHFFGLLPCWPLP